MACRFLLSLAIRSAASAQENIFLKTPDDFVGGEKSNKKNPPLRGLCDALRFDFGGTRGIEKLLKNRMNAGFIEFNASQLPPKLPL